jgi:hypothetical protein
VLFGGLEGEVAVFWRGRLLVGAREGAILAWKLGQILSS